MKSNALTFSGFPHYSLGITQSVMQITTRRIGQDLAKFQFAYFRSFVGGFNERLAVLRSRQTDKANPFATAKKDVRRAFIILDGCMTQAFAHAEVGLNMTGSQRLN
jgi:hypothetical protein